MRPQKSQRSHCCQREKLSWIAGFANWPRSVFSRSPVRDRQLGGICKTDLPSLWSRDFDLMINPRIEPLRNGAEIAGPPRASRASQSTWPRRVDEDPREILLHRSALHHATSHPRESAPRRRGGCRGIRTNSGARSQRPAAFSLSLSSPHPFPSTWRTRVCIPARCFTKCTHCTGFNYPATLAARGRTSSLFRGRSRAARQRRDADEKRNPTENGSREAGTRRAIIAIGSFASVKCRELDLWIKVAPLASFVVANPCIGRLSPIRIRTSR